MFSALLFTAVLPGAMAAETIVATAQATDSLSRFVEVITAPAYKAILDAANAATAQAPITVFAPNNAAFTAAESALGFNFVTTTDTSEQATVLAVLQYHVMSGKLSSTQLVGAYSSPVLSGEQAVVISPPALIRGKSEVAISTPDVDCTNGYVHIVGGVILIPDTVAAIAQASTQTLYTVLADPLYSDILAVVTGATAAAPITVFAPTDAAFAAAGIDVAYVQDPDNVAAVKEILKYHVVPSNVFAGAVEGSATPIELTTAEGSKLTLTKVGAKGVVGTVTVADTKTPSDPATVNPGDVLASNGVVHVVNKVLMMAAGPSPPSPPSPSPPSSAAGAFVSMATLLGCMLVALAL